jgi:hypothetical protein
MTAARQERKPPRLLRLLVTVALGMGIFAPWGSRAATDYQAVNVTSGLSISGFDPVAYFTEGKALFGRPELELNLDGAVWRFSNEGNRGAFAKHPEVYSPRFGGYDPVAIGRGRSVAGPSLIWVVSGSGSISSTVNRRAPLSSRIPDVLSIPQSANGPRLLATNASLPVRRCRSAGISPGNESRHPKVFGNAAVR